MSIPDSIKNLFQSQGGILRRKDILPELISPPLLKRYLEQGLIQKWGRGLYRLGDEELPDNPDLLVVATKYPAAVICLVSALSFHDLTTQIPHVIDIAIPRTSSPPKATYPPLRTFRLSPAIYEAGIEKHDLNGIILKVYDKEKTLVDVFRFRNKLGMDVFLEAIKIYSERGAVNLPLIHKYAALRNLTQSIMPYLEMLV